MWAMTGSSLLRLSVRDRIDFGRWLVPFRLSACDEVGPGVRAEGRPLVENEGRIEIGRDTTLRSLGRPIRLSATRSGTISIGSNVEIDMGVTLYSDASIQIGDGAVIGANALICDRDGDTRSGPLVIGKKARIGVGVRILGPCRIGDGAVVVAGSTVRAHVPNGEVVTPAESADGAKATGDDDPAEAPPATQRSPPPIMRPVRRVDAVLIADSTIDELSGHLAVPDLSDLDVNCELAPFDQVIPTLLALADRQPKADLALVWTRLDRVSPSFGELLLGGSPDLSAILLEVDEFAAALKASAAFGRLILVPSWTLPPWRRGLGVLELRGEHAANVLMRMNLRLADALAQISNLFVIDAQRWMACADDGGVDPKLWHAGKISFTSGVFAEAARDIRSALRAALGLSRKLLVVDLDDTMWGGIVGDVGWQNLRLGGHDANGEAFVQFQKQLIALTKRGVALAVVSKNEEATALAAMREHPEMQIRPEMLAAYRINWSDKAQNIAEIARELNLGLQSVVFIDDNPIERGRVRETLPEVYVPEWPADPTRYSRALERLGCFDSVHISAEDVERNAAYAIDRERVSSRRLVPSLDEWLATLDLKVRFEPIGSSNVARAAQLLNKTNQMNLRTRRLTERDLVEWSGLDGHEMWTVHVADRFGPAGLTGLLGLARVGSDVHVTDYVLSCRVMGRRVEETMVWAAKHRARALGAQRLVVVPVPTAKNKPCIDFFERAGLPKEEEGYVQPLDSPDPSPALVTMDGIVQ
jgi:FkbH-like protein